MIDLDIDEKTDLELVKLIRINGTYTCKSLLHAALLKIKKCSIGSCNKKSEIKGYCKSHYNDVYYGFIDKEGNKIREKYTHAHDKPCKICDIKAYSKGFCPHHYNQFYKGRIDIDGNEYSIPIKKKSIKRYTGCSIKGCKIKHHAKGFCSVHYKRNKRGTL